MTLNDGSKDNETILAVWPSYDAIFSGWVMQELTQTGGATPRWRTRRITHPLGFITLDLYRDEENAREMISTENFHMSKTSSAMHGLQMAQSDFQGRINDYSKTKKSQKTQRENAPEISLDIEERKTSQ